MKLKFYTDSEGKKIYTLNGEIPDSKEKTAEAHYKFIKIRDVPRSNMKSIRKD